MKSVCPQFGKITKSEVFWRDKFLSSNLPACNIKNRTKQVKTKKKK